MTAAQVPFFDLSAQHESLRRELLAAIARVVDSSHFILGDEVVAFEAELAAYVGTAQAVGVSSGTDALLAALMALDVGPGDEVITTPYSFVATAMVIARLGARAVFADIDPATFNVDPALVAAKVGPKTKAIVPVHLFGQCADVAAYASLGVPVIEDAAQAIGAERDGIRAGARGVMGCFSFFPTKNLGALGDGGAVVTNDGALAARLRALRGQGQRDRHHSTIVGGNFRLDALQAAALRVKLPHVDRWTEARQALASRYRALFADVGVRTPAPSAPTARHVHNQFVIRVERRDELRAFLRDRGVGTEIYYPRPLHLHEAFDSWGYRQGDFPEAERAANETVALPIFPELTTAQQDRVVAEIAAFVRR